LANRLGIAGQFSKKSEPAGAIRYALSRWEALCRYRDDGRAELDNNAVDRALRAAALRRKNHLFAGADIRGERAAGIYCIRRTDRMGGTNAHSRRGNSTHFGTGRDSPPQVAATTSPSSTRF
jgi:hypothetical protein